MTEFSPADWIGRSETAADSADFRTAARMAGLLDRDAPAAGAPLPPVWIWACFWPAMRHGAAGADGHPAEEALRPPIPLPRRMWVGSRITIARPVTIGETIRRVSTLTDIREKTGRQGRLAFVTLTHQVTGNAGADLTEAQTIVYREDATAPATDTASAPGPGPGFAPAFSRMVTPDPLLLFQYSAVTYNTHRIHYDAPYVTAAEGYPALLVHGPLTATLLMDLLERSFPDRPVAELEVTALRPLFVGTPIRLAGRSDGDAFQLVALTADDHPAMRITGRFGNN